VKRNFARLGTVLAGIAMPVLLAATPALANIKPDDGEHPGSSIGAGMIILLFVVVPVGAFLIISALALLPSTLARPRYRPGRPWDNEPVWVGGPGQDAPSSSTAPGTAKGGASAEW
jgi:hypothetical protein